jgi:hypothetical protein
LRTDVCARHSAVYPGKRNEHAGTIACLPRSQHLTPLGFGIRRSAKDVVYISPMSTSLCGLQQRDTKAVNTAHRDVLQRT